MLVYTNIMKNTSRKQIIMQKALDLAAKCGFSGMTTATLAKAMKVSEPIIYQHFESKTELFETLLADVISEVTEEFHNTIAEGIDPLDSLRRMVRSYPATAVKHRKQFAIINRALAEPISNKFRKLLIEHYAQYSTVLSEIISRGQALGQIRIDIPANTISWHLIHSAIGFLLMGPFRNSTGPQVEFEDGLAVLTLEGFVIGETL